MPASSVTIAMFFLPGAPLPPLPLVLVQTNMSLHCPTPLAQEHFSKPNPLKREASTSEFESPPSKRTRLETPPLVVELVMPDAPLKMQKKPSGEPGRPGTGGFSIEVALGWHPTAFEKLKVSTIFLHFRPST